MPTQQPRPPRRAALVVGVNQAPALAAPPLGSAEADARAVAAALEAAPCGFTVTLLQGAEADTRALQIAIDDLLGDAGPADELLLYFAGHAAPVEPDNPHSEVLLVTADFDPARARRRPELFLALGTLHRTLYQAAEPGSVAIILDCCYAGNLVGPQPAPAPLDLQRLFEQYLRGREEQPAASFAGKLRWLLAAAGPGETAAEALGHGLLTAPLLDALAGRLPAALSEGLLTPHSLMAALDGRLWGGQRPASLLAGQRSLALADFRDALAATRQSAEDQARRRDAEAREQRLRALLHDHSGFMRDRLESFVGRTQEQADIQALIAQTSPTGGYVTITGQAGQGKSSLIARMILLSMREALARRGEPAEGQDLVALVRRAGPDVPVYHFIPFQPGPDHQVGLMRNLMARLILKHDLSEIYVASDSRPALRDYFARALEEIAARGVGEIIYIDGLDQLEEEANGARDLSFLPPDPPDGIVFVLGTRPNDVLRPLELRKPNSIYALPNLSRADFDLVLAHRGAQLDPALADRFYATMHASALYLDLVARELAQDDAADPEAIIERVADDPRHLFSLSIERLRRAGDIWRAVIKPILGLLLAAQEPLHPRAMRTLIGRDLEATREGIDRLGGLLLRDGQDRVTLFHLKLRDFLREDPRQPQRAALFAIDEEQEWHARLADWCERGAGTLDTIWQDRPGDPLEQGRRTYARRHYLAHLCLAGAWPRLWEALDTGDYGRAKLRHAPSAAGFASDLDLVRQRIVAATEGEVAAGLEWLPQLWRYSLLRCSLASQADSYPPGLIPLLAELGRAQEAIGLAELLTDVQRKAETLARISVVLERQGLTTEAQQLAARVITFTSTHRAIIELDMPPEDRIPALAGMEQEREATSEYQTIEAGMLFGWSQELLAVLTKQSPGGADTQLWASRAMETARSIDEASLQARAQKQIARKLLQAGLLPKARACADEASRAARNTAYSALPAEALVAMAKALVADARYVEATRLEISIQHPDARSEVEAAITVALAASNAPALAQPNPPKPHEQIAQALALAAAGQGGDIPNLFPEIDSAAKRDRLLGEIAVALAQAGYVADASQTIGAIVESYWHDTAQQDVTVALAAAGHTAAARDLLGSLRPQSGMLTAVRRVTETLIKVLQTLIDTGQWQEVSQWLDDLIAHCATLDRSGLQLDPIAHLLARISDPPTALAVVQRHWSVVTRRDDLVALLPAATALIAAHPPLLEQLLDGFEWVRKQLE
ncbi:MAG TPA: hypothetical protein VFS21_22425 [Roseiflexaceae bacterium]|nr:hypothetical protein [Roseiflexaceae bacterium]